jgi:tripartite-type tricarboxylate transporter receptor subunit TctC
MRFQRLFGWLCAVALCPTFAQAQAAGPAPEPKITRILIGYGAGGGADAITRAYADALSARLHRPFIVENRPGAGGTMALGVAKNSPRDGSVLVFGNVLTNVLAPYTFRNVPYDAAHDFVPVGEMAHFDLALAVGTGSPARTLPEFIAWVKADPTRASFGTAGAGSLPHFFGLLLGQATGLPMVHVPYKSGAAINTDLIGGQLPSAISALSDYVQMQKAGRLHMLATSGARRTRFTPDVPTFRELGYPQLTGSSFFALFAPTGLAPSELSKLRAALRDAGSDPRVQKVVEGLGIEMPDGSVEEFEQKLEADRKRWGEVVKASGFTSDK